jgi:hypothetical protein
LSINCDENELSNNVISEVGKLNKIINVNLVVLRIQNTKKLTKELEEFLIKLIKKF